MNAGYKVNSSIYRPLEGELQCWYQNDSPVLDRHYNTIVGENLGYSSDNNQCIDKSSDCNFALSESGLISQLCNCSDENMNWCFQHNNVYSVHNSDKFGFISFTESQPLCSSHPMSLTVTV